MKDAENERKIRMKKEGKIKKLKDVENECEKDQSEMRRLEIEGKDKTIKV